MIISGLIPVPYIKEGRNRKIGKLNVWLRIWCRGSGSDFWTIRTYFGRGVQEGQSEPELEGNKYPGGLVCKWLVGLN